MSTLILNVNGSYRIEFFKITGEEVSAKVAKKIQENLKSGDYVLSINSNRIASLDKLNKTLYTFQLEAVSVEYEHETEEAEDEEI